MHFARQERLTRRGMTNFPLSQPHAFMHDSRDHSSASRQLPHRRAWLVLALLGGRHRKREEAVAACAADEKAEWDRIAAEEEADRTARTADGPSISLLSSIETDLDVLTDMCSPAAINQHRLHPLLRLRQTSTNSPTSV